MRVFITNNIVRDILVGNLKTSKDYFYLFFYFIYIMITKYSIPLENLYIIIINISNLRKLSSIYIILNKLIFSISIIKSIIIIL